MEKHGNISIKSESDLHEGDWEADLYDGPMRHERSMNLVKDALAYILSFCYGSEENDINNLLYNIHMNIRTDGEGRPTALTIHPIAIQENHMLGFPELAPHINAFLEDASNYAEEYEVGLFVEGNTIEFEHPMELAKLLTFIGQHKDIQTLDAIGFDTLDEEAYKERSDIELSEIFNTVSSKGKLCKKDFLKDPDNLEIFMRRIPARNYTGFGHVDFVTYGMHADHITVLDYDLEEIVTAIQQEWGGNGGPLYNPLCLIN